MAIEKSQWNCPSHFMKCASYVGISFLDLIFFPEHSESNPFLAAFILIETELFPFSSFPVFVDSLHILFSFLHLLFWDHTLNSQLLKMGCIVHLGQNRLECLLKMCISGHFSVVLKQILCLTFWGTVLQSGCVISIPASSVWKFKLVHRLAQPCFLSFRLYPS